MPIPTPRKGQSQQEFISSCMGDKIMNEDYKDQKQRAAICYSKWREKTKKASYIVDIAGEEIAYFDEETEESGEK